MSSDMQPSSSSSEFPVDVHRQIDAAGYYKKYLRQNVRPDGRKLRAFRTVSVSDLEGRYTPPNLLEGDGAVISSTRLTLGDTHVYCSVKALPVFCEVIMPPSLGSDDLLSVDIELPKQVQSYIYDANGHSANLNFSIASMLSNVLNSDDLIPKSQFRFEDILKRVTSQSTDAVCKYLSQRNLIWKFEVSIVCEEYDGNLTDSCAMVASFALRKAMLPIVLLDISNTSGSYIIRAIDQKLIESALSGDAEVMKLLHNNRRSIEQQLGIELENDNLVDYLSQNILPGSYVGIPLTITALPFTVTFLRFSEETFFVDPTSEEERLGTSVSVYCLSLSDGSFVTQPLNLTCCPGISSDIYSGLKAVALDVISCISNSDI
ncbi:3' exoribonuclease family domain 1 protein [Babesia bovis T2Bo]|uniref:Ribosomal RNA-processing protein 43 n=1 Tax=Babesia bovis TaxID=5865 RepID=A7ANY0_BABBO|nr:3' exoribonuclease family domain 1 protein [Babesia bovis T2Bo]EDO08264.1 3' exoribonuclease family domain 1 protein [Babesia bovis T2Bo]|eukprot:XP_001611832.1 hypothetical protein [Babesia bovis T2Bo]